MAAQVDDVESDVADGHGVALGDAHVDRDGQRVGVVGPGDRAGTGRRHDLGERADVVVVLVGRDDGVESLRRPTATSSSSRSGSAAASTSSCAPVDRQVSR